MRRRFSEHRYLFTVWCLLIGTRVPSRDASWNRAINLIKLTAVSAGRAYQCQVLPRIPQLPLEWHHAMLRRTALSIQLSSPPSPRAALISFKCLCVFPSAATRDASWNGVIHLIKLAAVSAGRAYQFQVLLRIPRLGDRPLIGFKCHAPKRPRPTCLSCLRLAARLISSDTAGLLGSEADRANSTTPLPSTAIRHRCTRHHRWGIRRRNASLGKSEAEQQRSRQEPPLKGECD